MSYTFTKQTNTTRLKNKTETLTNIKDGLRDLETVKMSDLRPCNFLCQMMRQN